MHARCTLPYNLILMTSAPSPPASKIAKLIKSLMSVSLHHWEELFLMLRSVNLLFYLACTPSAVSSIHARDICIPVVNSARCLGARWTSNLSCSKWIDANIKKARGAFFGRGSGVFHGTLNPVSYRSIVESCVCPHSSIRCWIMDPECYLLQKLEFSQEEIAKQVLAFQSTLPTMLLAWLYSCLLSNPMSWSSNYASSWESSRMTTL